MAEPWESDPIVSKGAAPWEADPMAVSESVPQAFLDRIRAGRYLAGDIGGSMPEAHADFFQTFEGRQLKGAWDMFTLPGRVMSGETRLDTKEGMNEAIGMGVGIALGRMNRLPGNAEGVPIIDQGDGRFARPHVDENGQPQVATIGGLPKPEDFANAGKILDSPHAEANLRRMWAEDGIHPAEAVHDAQNDAFLKHDITEVAEPVRPFKAPPKFDYRAAMLDQGYSADQVSRMSPKQMVDSWAATEQVRKQAWFDQQGGSSDPQAWAERADLRREVESDLQSGRVIMPENPKPLEQGAYRNRDPELIQDAAHEVTAWAGGDTVEAISALQKEVEEGRVSDVNTGVWNEDVIEAIKNGALKHDPSSIEAGLQDFIDRSPEGSARSLGAAVNTDPPLTPLSVQPASPPGRLAAAWQSASDGLFDIGRDAQMLIAPMATGTRDSMALAKDFANSMRRNRWDWSRIDKDIADKFTPEQRARMWNAADEESLSLRLEEPASMREHQGLATLEPAERAMVEQLQTRSQNAWVRARDIGMVEGEGLPAYTPRMIINVASAGSKDTALALDGIGGNLRTKTGNLLKRKYMESQDTQAAAQAKYGDQAMLARDIRVLPLATSQLEDAIAGRTLINEIKAYGERTGTETVSEGAIPSGSETKWFTLDHPSFKTWRPKFQDGAVVKDEAGNAIFEQVPLYVHGDFEGPLRAVLSQKSGATYGALMSLKGKTMSLIMNSPMIHNAVEWGRAFPAAPFKVGTFKVYFEGNAAKHGYDFTGVPRYIKDWTTGNRVKIDGGSAIMAEAIDNGLVPIGHRFFNQDITSVMESPDLAPGRSLTAKTLALIPGLFDEAAGTAVKRAIDKAGDFWHNTLLWDRVGDLQMGLYKNFLDAGIEKGLDRQTSARVAAHMANRYAGALPKEAMSDGATKVANIMLFSRSFTLGNLGVMKDMLTGLPKDVLAQIERDAGFGEGAISQFDAEALSSEAGGARQPAVDAVKFAKSMARRKAISTVALDVGLLVIGNSVLQSALNVMLGDNTLGQEGHGYVRRFKDYLDKGSQNPLSMLWPPNITGLSSTAENEPGLENRLKVGHTKDGTAIYARNPVGKIGEEFVGWPTSPLDMLRKKEGTIARPMLQILSNDAGFGRKIYDPDAQTPAAMAGTVWAIAKHLAGSQLPEGQITALSDLVKGEGDKTVNELQLAGPLAGVTFRKGAPGGEAVGEMYHNKAAFEFRVQQAMPDIRKQILRGDQAGAQDRMTALGLDASYSRWVLKTTLNPATRLGAKAMRDFYRTATPEQRDRMTRIQQAPQAP